MVPTSLANCNHTYSIWNPKDSVGISVPGIQQDGTTDRQTDRPTNHVVIVCIGVKNVTWNVKGLVMQVFRVDS